ncbi:MAG TPA: TonB-dependent receptor, partial [Novosphingobium sp.]|nr:TonB-dependent receptor [Novosphingobium sp.]
WSIPDRNRLFAWDTAVHINYQLDGAEIVAISDYRHFRKDYGTDVDAGPENLIDFISDSVEHSFSQELRIAGAKKGPVRWVAGAYFLDINSLVHNGFKAPSNSVFAAYYPGYAQSGIDLINDVNLKTESISAFAQGEYDFAPKLTLILGGRIIHEHQDYTFDSMAHANTNDYEFTYGPALFQLQDPYANKRNTLMWAGKAQVEYRPAKGTLLYFGVNRGVKGGAYNAQLPDGSASLSPSRIAYNPETLVAYEAGLKTGFWHNMLTLDLSGYYYDYHNYQAFTFSNVSGIVSNNDARNFGMEASLNLRPARGLNIGLGLSLIDAKVKHVAIATGIYKDVRPTFTPAKTLAAQIGYTLPEQLAGGDINFNIDGSWRSKVYANIRNFDADIINPYFLANMHVYWNRGPLRL